MGGIVRTHQSGDGAIGVVVDDGDDGGDGVVVGEQVGVLQWVRCLQKNSVHHKDPLQGNSL